MTCIADGKILFESPDPQGIFCYSPSLCHGFDGRIIGAIDLGGPGTAKLAGAKSSSGDYASGNQLRLFYTDDRFRSWTFSESAPPMLHEILFKAGDAIYMIGQSGALLISRSIDNGVTWSEPFVLEARHRWQDGVGQINHHDGRVYVSYGRAFEAGPWSMPVVLSAPEKADLTKPENWTFSDPFDPRPILEAARSCGMASYVYPGVIEVNLTRIYDPAHEYYDSEMRTLMLLMRTSCERHVPGMGNLAGVLKCVEKENGKLCIERQTTKDGYRLFYVPWPGGSIKFFLEYDPVSRCYWMAASVLDGKAEVRRRLGLYYSYNLFDWVLAGLIAEGPADNAARNYASLLIDGEDIFVLSRSGDERAKNAHDNNLSTIHCVRNFRQFIIGDAQCGKRDKS